MFENELEASNVWTVMPKPPRIAVVPSPKRSYANPSRGCHCGGAGFRHPVAASGSLSVMSPLNVSPEPGTMNPMSDADTAWPVTASNPTRVPLTMAGAYRRTCFDVSNRSSENDAPSLRPPLSARSSGYPTIGVLSV